MKRVKIVQRERPLPTPVTATPLETETCEYCRGQIITRGKGAESYVSRREGWHNRKFWHNMLTDGKDCWYQAGRDKPSEPKNLEVGDGYSFSWQKQQGKATVLALWFLAALVWGFLGGEVSKTPKSFSPTKIERNVVKVAQVSEEDQRILSFLLFLLQHIEDQEDEEPMIEDGPNTEGIEV